MPEEPKGTNLSDYIKLNKQYVLDLTAIVKDDDDKIKDLNSNLNSIATDVSSKTVASNDLINKQNEVKTILDSEHGYLKDKETDILAASQGQKRLIHFNQSYSEKYRAFNKISFGVIVAFILIIGLIYQKKWFDVIPDFVNTLLYITIFACLIIYIMFMLVEIASRDKMDYDKINIPGPNIMTESELTQQRDKLIRDGKLSDLSEVCKGGDCCSDGMEFSSSKGKCVIISPAPVEDAAAGADTTGADTTGTNTP